MAWARKMPALTRPKTAATESIIANVPLCPRGRASFALLIVVDALATGQLHVWVVASDVGMIGDNQSAGITVAYVSALDARERAQTRVELVIDLKGRQSDATRSVMLTDRTDRYGSANEMAFSQIDRA